MLVKPQKDMIVEIRSYRLDRGVHKDIFMQELGDFTTEKEFQALTVLNPEVFPTVNTVASAAWHALNAFNSGNNISSNLSLEIMLYISCQRQIKEVLDQYGVEEEVKEFIVIAVHDKKKELAAELDDFVASRWNGVTAADLIAPPAGDRARKIAKLYGIDRFDEKKLLEKITSFSIEMAAT